MKESNLVKGFITAVAIFAISAPAIAAAGAYNGLKGKSVKVSYADLNLQKEEGAQVLYRRIQQASRQACGVESLKIAGSVAQFSAAKRCYRDTLSATVDKLDSVEVTKIHES